MILNRAKRGIRALVLSIPWILSAAPCPKDRPSQAPFVSGDSFRAYSDFAYDADGTFDPAQVSPSNVIFVQGDHLSRFFETLHPQIAHPYILLTHNSDEPSPGQFAHFLNDQKIIAWFGENYDGTKHPKMHPIPMGIVSASRPNGSTEVIDQIRKESPLKMHLAHMNCAIQNHFEERWNVYMHFREAKYCFRSAIKPFYKYLFDVASSHFEVSPRGFAVDTFRVWECFYIGTIPIVKTSSLDELYSGLPILIIDDWKKVNEDFLLEKLTELKNKHYPGMEKLEFDYWVRLIDSVKS